MLFKDKMIKWANNENFQAKIDEALISFKNKYEKSIQILKDLEQSKNIF